MRIKSLKLSIFFTRIEEQTLSYEHFVSDVIFILKNSLARPLPHKIKKVEVKLVIKSELFGHSRSRVDLTREKKRAYLRSDFKITVF